MRREPSILRLSLLVQNLDSFNFIVNLRNCDIAAQTRERQAKRIAPREARKISEVKLLEKPNQLKSIVVDLQSSENTSQANAEILAATLEKLNRRQDMVQ